MASAAAVTTATTLTTLDNEQVQADIDDVTQDVAVEADVPDAVLMGTVGAQTAGEAIDGLELNDIRWNDHGTYFRIVFDLVYAGVEQVQQAPHADAVMSSDQTTVDVTLGGIRGISERPAILVNEIDVGDTMVLSLERLPSYDDQALIYRIQLAAPATYTLSSLGEPGRVIIDIYK